MLGVGLSVDGGRSWQATTGFSSWEINDFTWHPSDAQTVWVGTLSGPYKSTDGGRTWIAKRVGLPTGDYPYSAPVQKVVFDPTDVNHLLAFGGNQRQFVEGGTGALHCGLVYESHDGGEHWSTLANLGTNLNVLDVVHPAADLATLYAVVLSRGVFRSDDGGRTWRAVNGGLPNLEARGLAIDPHNRDVVWAALDHDPTPIGGVYRPGGIYKTTDGGQSWSPADQGLPQNAETSPSLSTSMYSVHRAADGTLYTADQGYADQGRYRSIDGGASWTPAGTSFAKFYPAEATPYVWASSAAGDRIIGGTSDTIMGSSNRGLSWADLGSTQTPNGNWHGNGFSGLLGTRVAFSPSRPGTMLLTAFDGGNVLRSEDAGASWTRPLAAWDNYGGGYDIGVGGRSGEVVYAVLGQAGGFNGIAVSVDSGRTWSTHVGGTLPQRYAFGEDRGAVAIASSDGATAYVVLPDGGLYMTADTGVTWSSVRIGSPAYAVAATPGHSATYVATDAGVYELGPSGLVRLMEGSPLSQRRLVTSSDGTLYGTGQLGGNASTAGLWRYASGSWIRLSSDPWVNDVAIDPYQSKRIVYVTNDNPYHDRSFATGVWLSCNQGRSFTPRNRGLAMTRVMSVAFDPLSPGRLVIGTNGRGLANPTSGLLNWLAAVDPTIAYCTPPHNRLRCRDETGSRAAAPASADCARHTGSLRSTPAAASCVRSTNVRDTADFDVDRALVSACSPTGSCVGRYRRVETPASIRFSTTRASGLRSAKCS